MTARAAIFVATLWISGSLARAHDPITTKITWAREVSRIVYARCLSCHRPDSAAFSLARYEEVRPWAMAIKEEVLLRRMPPWNAVKGFGRFRDEQSLTQQERSTIAEWVEGGAPEGDLRDLPPIPPTFPSSHTPIARRMPVADGSILDRRLVAIGISVPPGGSNESLQVMAVRPDGRVEPLVWVRRVNPADPGVYWFVRKLDLPARTRIRTVPAVGSATLLLD